MNTPSASSPSAPSPRPGSSWGKKLLIVLLVLLACCGITAAATAWWVKRNVYASPFKPVSLTQAEQKAYDEKVGVLNAGGSTATISTNGDKNAASDDKRTLVVTDKEINAWIATQGLGDQIKVDLGDGSAAATLIAPVDKDVPVIGGKTFRIRVGLATGAKADGSVSLAVSDVSIGGVPVPNAWLGDLKGVNLLADKTGRDPVVKRFLAGIREFQIKSGEIRVRLNE
ncbi:MAG: hypothetical protein K1X78_05025 [Verrucomicrobiaceae bacterium]|nr:hypothetical protein [Verrucomicrobiaceae bacterium]